MARFSLKSWWQARRPGPWRIGVVVAEADQIPVTMSRYEATLVAPHGLPKWLAFDCPCERGHRIMLNLDPARSPRWKVIRQRPLTLSPSIDVDSYGQRCHYVVYHGHVNWVPSYKGGKRSRCASPRTI